MLKNKGFAAGMLLRKGYTEDREIHFNIHCPVIGQVGIGLCLIGQVGIGLCL